MVSRQQTLEKAMKELGTIQQERGQRRTDIARQQELIRTETAKFNRTHPRTIINYHQGNEGETSSDEEDMTSSIISSVKITKSYPSRGAPSKRE